MNCKFLRRFSIISFLLVCSLQLLAVPMPEGWKQAANCRKDEGNFTATVSGQEPFEIIIRGKASERNVKVTLAPNEIKAAELLADNKTADLKITRTYPAPAAPQANVEYTVKIRDNEWSFFVDGALRAIMPSVFALPGTFSVQNEQAARLQGAAKFLPVPKVSFLTNFMIEEGAPNELYPWNINTGTWRLHTALQQALIRPETDQASAKRAPLTADKSPNFYSLKGGGANVDNVITTGYDFYDNYSITCSIQLEKGEGGVVFYHRDEVLPPPAEGKEAPKPDPAKAEFYAFTMRMNVPSDGQHEVRLWHQKNGVKRLLARAEVPLYANQWYLPGVAAHGDEIICYLDHYELFRVTEPLPVGGKFGMFLNTPEETRMDDVTVKHFADIKLETPEGIQFNMLHSEGNVAHGLDAAKKPQITMTDDALFALGRTQSVNRVFEATVEPKSNGWTLGLATEWTAHAAPSTRFSIARKADNSAETYTLYTATPGQENKVIETFEHVLTDAEKKAASFKLMLDATEKGKLRALKDGKLVFIWQRGNDFVGANALWTAQGTTAVFSNLKLNTERVQIKELEQKNPIFRTDSFMRHWASPEGQWIAGKAKAMWHKGDFFSDFYIKLPCIPNSDFNVAVPDDADNGPVSIVIKDGKIVFSVKEFKDKDAVVQEFALTPPEGKGIETLDYELYHEGYWLWIDVAGKTVLRHRLTGSLRSIGTRARVIGMGIPELARSKVTRTNVIDEFFNESPHDWLANGGDWQIINRFQCTPSWSHMIGEAHESLGAFWRKQIFKGDMVLEFYAGSRQGAYDEMGNLNCTIMAQDNTANSGYTVACTEWDQNLSQNWTTMYKNGVPLQKSDAYLVPRRRKGLVRKVLNPLIAQGRPYHGAWYYIKLRKIGDKLEYYFDDELIFTQKDTDVLNEGIVGIWTFIHSMTLAQIKITFDDVRPRPVLVKMLPLEEPKPLPAPDPFKWNTALGLFNVDPLAAAYWTINDKVGQSTFTPFKTADGGSAFLYHNCLGSGNMLTSTTGGATAEKLSNIAGWQIKLKRTEKARFNIMYEICSKNDKGEYTANRHCFQHVSGDEFTDNQWRMMGHSDVPPVAQVTAEDKDWTTVTVWIPGRLRRADDASSQRLVRLVGFGIEQLDAMMNGIWGNGPGSAYAVGDITPIFYDAPVISAEEGASFKVSSDAADSKFSLEAANPQQLKSMLDAVSKVGLNTATLQLTLKDRKLTRKLAWIKLADTIP
ncbi:MAG: hypothetical protein IKN52_06880, partial [Victivallales bacterium]|nr:hypothetical protein [Victivallales bacterium]